MNRQEQLALIRQKCVEANPEIDELKVFVCNNCADDGDVHYRPIRLADVLWLLEEKKVAKQIGFDKIGDFALHMWNLRKDSLEEQSDETLADLLKKV
jgi:hypothetical protein